MADTRRNSLFQLLQECSNATSLHPPLSSSSPFFQKKGTNISRLHSHIFLLSSSLLLLLCRLYVFPIFRVLRGREPLERRERETLTEISAFSMSSLSGCSDRTARASASTMLAVTSRASPSNNNNNNKESNPISDVYSNPICVMAAAISRE